MLDVPHQLSLEPAYYSRPEALPADLAAGKDLHGLEVLLDFLMRLRTASVAR